MLTTLVIAYCDTRIKVGHNRLPTVLALYAPARRVSLQRTPASAGRPSAWPPCSGRTKIGLRQLARGSASLNPQHFPRLPDGETRLSNKR